MVANEVCRYSLCPFCIALLQVYAGKVIGHFEEVFVAELNLLESVVCLIEVAFVVVGCCKVELCIVGMRLACRCKLAQHGYALIFLAALLHRESIIEPCPVALFLRKTLHVALCEPIACKVVIAGIVVRFCDIAVKQSAFGGRVVVDVLQQQGSSFESVCFECNQCQQ